MLGTTTISSTSPTESSGENLNVLRWLKVIVLFSLISRFTFSQSSLQDKTKHNQNLLLNILYRNKLIAQENPVL